MMDLNGKTEIPYIDPSLLKALEEVFPQSDFTPKTGVRDLDFHYGQRSVINYLKHQVQIQNENILS